MSLLLALTNLSHTIQAQAPEWLWAKSAGGKNSDQGQSICADASGNILVTGYFDSPSITFGYATLINSGGSDIYIAKYDA